ncbi:MAG: helix-turn-helix transcriptional regulator [Ruminococcaceae bacterium]|nr:helix-turn-helix transcriptional regulator [Oscillospiraceae bacterium]
MKSILRFDLPNIIRQIKTEGISIRRRFVAYIISAIALVLSLILLLLNLFGIMNPTGARIMDVLDTRLSAYAETIRRDYEKAAAHAISFADGLETALQDFLTGQDLTFEALKNNADALSSLQNALYDVVYLHMQLTPSSGAFFILDTTVNSRSDVPLYNGIYLKYINLYSESTLNNEITLYRGSFSTAKKGNVTFHSGWNNEMRTDFFDSCDSAFAGGTHYILSRTVEIPDTWERARYIYVPIRDPSEHIIGVCGFEINDMYFQLSKKVSDDKLGQLVGALLDEEMDIYTGQFNSGRYNSIDSDSVTITGKGRNAVFDFGSEICIGKTRVLTLGRDTFTAALMITEAQFDALVRNGQLKTVGIILAVVLIMFAYCLFLSKKYVAPILRRIEQIKYSEDSGDSLKIREFDDLFAFIERKASVHEEQLKNLEAAKIAAEEEAGRAREAYEKALAEYELAKSQILQLSEESKNEIVLEDYEYFICNLKTLTPQEMRIYEMYAEGKSTAEIAAAIGIKENTMKYHNKNIYSKLGVNSRKQFLRFAALKQYRDQNRHDEPEA